HVCERVRGVRVATSGRGDDVLTRERESGDRLTRGDVALEVLHVRGVSDVVLERVHEHGGNEPAVLTDLVQFRVGGAGQADVLEDAAQLFGLTGPAEHEVVDVGFPRAKARARAGAGRAGLVAVAAVAGTSEV